MRTVFFGTSEFASAVLERVAAGVHRPLLVATRPDRPAGRGRTLQSPPAADTARELGIPLAQPENVNDQPARDLIAGVEPDAVVVCAFGALISEPLLSEHEMLNVHPSLLPRWRGAAPIERAIMAGDAETGVSIMRLIAGLDCGPVCLAAREPIEPHDTYGSLAPRLARGGGDLLVSVLDAIGRGEPPAFAEQDERRATYAEKIGPADRLLDPARPADELERVVRALHPHVGAHTALPDGTPLGVGAAAVLNPSSVGERAEHAAVASVRGVYSDGARLLLGCASGTLELLVVQPPGGRPMDAAAFLRGHGLPA